MFLPIHVLAQNVDFDAKHKQCLNKIDDDAELAYEEAMIWQSQGGGRRARHCVAHALAALGHGEEAGFRLDKLAISPDGGNNKMRAAYYLQAARFWLEAGERKNAFNSASKGLELQSKNLDLRLMRARIYGAMDRWKDAETEANNALVFHPNNANALRMRARAKFRQGKLKSAKKDIEASLMADPTQVQTALLRGQINEKIRLKSK